MEEVYIAYFDFLGFKEFIFNNKDSHISKRMGHIFRDIEMCLGQRNFLDPKNGIMLSDLSKIKINCLNISDTVIYWTNDCEDESLQELIKVSYEFNWMEIKHNFPLRGSLVKGKLKRVQGSQTNTQGGSYAVDCLFGSGIVNAHLKTENQNWAGTVLDKSIVDDIVNGSLGISFLEEFAVKYRVPYKSCSVNEDEYVYKLTKGKINHEYFDNYVKDIERTFALDNKPTSSSTVAQKKQNTIEFFKTSIE